MNKIAVFPGSFDPPTAGHEEIIRKALLLFDKIIVGVGTNTSKQYLYPGEKRTEWIRNTFKGESKLEVNQYTGLTVDFCKKNGALFIVRGLRNASDFEFEKAIAHVNKQMDSGIETVFLLSSPEKSSIASSIVRELLRNKAEVKNFLASGVNL